MKAREVKRAKLVAVLLVEGLESDVASLDGRAEHNLLGLGCVLERAFVNGCAPGLAVLANEDFVVLHAAVGSVLSGCVDEALHVLDGIWYS